jgi:hypothetical protein
MNVHDDLFRAAELSQSELIRLLGALEAAELVAEGERLPGEADALKRAIWPFLKMYGRRDEHGSVDESILEQPRAWRPGDDGPAGVPD